MLDFMHQTDLNRRKSSEVINKEETLCNKPLITDRNKEKGNKHAGKCKYASS